MRTWAGEEASYGFVDGLSWGSLLQPVETFSIFRTLPFPHGKIHFFLSWLLWPLCPEEHLMFCLCWGWEMSWPRWEGRECLGLHIWFCISSRSSVSSRNTWQVSLQAQRICVTPSASALHLEGSSEVAFHVRLAVFTSSGCGKVEGSQCAPAPPLLSPHC